VKAVLLSTTFFYYLIICSSCEIAALITALLWSVSSIVFSEASVRIGSQQLNMNRLLLAAFFLAALVLFMAFRNLLPQNKYGSFSLVVLRDLCLEMDSCSNPFT
jgi:hypothetical protein